MESKALVVGYTVSVMTLSKTVLYWLQEYFSGCPPPPLFLFPLCLPPSLISESNGAGLMVGTRKWAIIL